MKLLKSKIPHNTGTHVHIGWMASDVREVKRAVHLARLFEPALATLVAPSRIRSFDGAAYDLAAPNAYCRPVSSSLPLARLESITTLSQMMEVLADADARYVTFNLRPMKRIQTAEVRMHHGTTDARKILLWLSVWMQILWAAKERSEVPSVPDTGLIEPSGDIIALAHKWLPNTGQPQQPRLLARLAERRREILEKSWGAIPEFAAWAQHQSTWRNP